MAVNYCALLSWHGEKDEEGNRIYTIAHDVRTDDVLDGPAIVMQAAGLPLPGSAYLFFNDEDDWAFCQPGMKVTPQVDNERNKFWRVEQKFSTKQADPTKCADQTIESPLDEPQKVSGESVTTTEEITQDRNGNPVRYSSWEPIRGQAAEFDTGRINITIEQNVLSLQLDLLESMRQTLNDAPLWDLSTRCWKFARYRFEVLYYGTCTKYYKRILEFEGNYNTWDKDVLDEGTKALNGHWLPNHVWLVDEINGAPPDAGNPSHFIRIKDKKGEPMHVVLDGDGIPVNIEDNYGFESATIAAGGSGYEINDELTLTGGTFTKAAKVRVTEVSPSTGAVVAVTVLEPGYYSIIPTDPVATTTEGAGTGCTLNVTWLFSPATTPGYVHIERYPESDFTLLGIPTSF